jgi:hypothetical protein
MSGMSKLGAIVEIFFVSCVANTMVAAYLFLTLYWIDTLSRSSFQSRLLGNKLKVSYIVCLVVLISEPIVLLTLAAMCYYEVARLTNAIFLSLSLLMLFTVNTIEGTRLLRLIRKVTSAATSSTKDSLAASATRMILAVSFALCFAFLAVVVVLFAVNNYTCYLVITLVYVVHALAILIITIPMQVVFSRKMFELTWSSTPKGSPQLRNQKENK